MADTEPLRRRAPVGHRAIAASVALLLAGAWSGCAGDGGAERPPYDPGRPLASPELYLPDLASVAGVSRGYLSFAPDGRTLYLTRYEAWGGDGLTTIEVSRFEDGGWSPLETAPFSGADRDHMPYPSPDGRWVYFISTRPVDGVPRDDFEIWRVAVEGDGWGEPEHLAELGSAGNEYGPAPTRSGRIFFSSDREGGLGSGDLYVADALGDRFASPAPLGAPVNGESGEWGVTLSPDETTLVFESSGRTEGLSASGDLYLSRFEDGAWSIPRHLPPPINSPQSEPGPRISPDGRLLFFGSSRSGVLATYRVDLAACLQAPASR